MKKTLSILLALALVLSMGVMTVFAAPTTTDGKVVLTADKSVAKVGDVITFTVTATPDSSLGLGALQFKLNYDTAALELISYDNAGYFGSASLNPAPGNLGYAAAQEIAITSVGAVVTASFKVLQTNATVTLALETYGLGNFETTDVTDSAIANAGSAAAVTVACDHTYSDWTVTTPATCTTAGEETRTCTACGATETRPTALAPHTPDSWEVVTPATCTEAGVEEQKCSVCGEVLDSRPIPALGHDISDWTVTLEPDCENPGEKTGVCSRCGEPVTEAIPALGHDIADVDWTVTLEPDCENPGEKTGVCSRCGEPVVEVIPALGHDFGEWVVTKEPTATEEGSKERVCSVCGEKETVAIDKLTVTTDTSVPNIPKTSGAVAGGIAALAMLSMAAGVAAVTMKKKHEDD